MSSYGRVRCARGTGPGQETDYFVTIHCFGRVAVDSIRLQ